MGDGRRYIMGVPSAVQQRFHHARMGSVIKSITGVKLSGEQ